MNSLDDVAMAREIEHAQKMQEQRIDLIRATYEVPQNIYTDPAETKKNPDQR